MESISNATVRTDLSVIDPATPEKATAAAPAGNVQTGQGASIHISAGGRSLNSAAPSRNSAANKAIENSNLPDQVKKLLVRIRELQEKLREKAEELAELAAKQNMDPRQRTVKVAALQQAIATITGSLNDANAMLNKALTEMRATSEQRQMVAGLLMM